MSYLWLLLLVESWNLLVEVAPPVAEDEEEDFLGHPLEDAREEGLVRLGTVPIAERPEHEQVFCGSETKLAETILGPAARGVDVADEVRARGIFWLFLTLAFVFDAFKPKAKPGTTGARAVAEEETNHVDAAGVDVFAISLGVAENDSARIFGFHERCDVFPVARPAIFAVDSSARVKEQLCDLYKTFACRGEKRSATRVGY